MKPRRKIHVNNEIWEYHISRNNIVFWSPDKRKLVVRTWDVVDRDVERGRYKRTNDGWIMPSDIKEYIETKILCLKISEKPARRMAMQQPLRLSPNSLLKRSQ